MGNRCGRPDWFWEPVLYGGILCDIGSHQVDQFLFYTGSKSAEVVASQVANVNHPDKPKFQDFGDMMLRGDQGFGYVRLDWFTPDGLGTWGDGRLFVLGTKGYIAPEVLMTMHLPFKDPNRKFPNARTDQHALAFAL